MFDFQYDTYEHEIERYFVHGMTYDGNFCVIDRDPVISGATPYYWTQSTLRRVGYGFLSYEEAMDYIRYAATGYNVDKIDAATIKIVKVKIITSHRMEAVD